MRKTHFVTFLSFLVLTLGGGTLIGFATRPDAWYAALAKPFFQPPGWLFAPVWTLLYILIALAGARLWARAPRSAAMLLWFIQLGLNFAWSPTFFGMHAPKASLVVMLALLIALLGTIREMLRVDRTAALLFLPYLAWVSFASLLNGAVVWLN